jgi:hypothetical protein
MAKLIEAKYNTDQPLYIPSEELLKIVAAHGSNNCVFTYIGGTTITVGQTLADATAARALEASLQASWLKCIKAGPDASGTVLNTNVFTTVA